MGQSLDGVQHELVVGQGYDEDRWLDMDQVYSLLSPCCEGMGVCSLCSALPTPAHRDECGGAAITTPLIMVR